MNLLPKTKKGWFWFRFLVSCLCTYNRCSQHSCRHYIRYYIVCNIRCALLLNREEWWWQWHNVKWYHFLCALCTTWSVSLFQWAYWSMCASASRICVYIVPSVLGCTVRAQYYIGYAILVGHTHGRRNKMQIKHTRVELYFLACTAAFT